MTVNWRDIRATIQQSTISTKKSVDLPVGLANDSEDRDSDSKCKNSELDSPADPVEDPLKWLDDGLPDLSGFNHHDFDLAEMLALS